MLRLIQALQEPEQERVLLQVLQERVPVQGQVLLLLQLRLLLRQLQVCEVLHLKQA